MISLSLELFFSTRDRKGPQLSKMPPGWLLHTLQVSTQRSSPQRDLLKQPLCHNLVMQSHGLVTDLTALTGIWDYRGQLSLYWVMAAAPSGNMSCETGDLFCLVPSCIPGTQTDTCHCKVFHARIGVSQRAVRMEVPGRAKRRKRQYVF